MQQSPSDIIIIIILVQCKSTLKAFFSMVSVVFFSLSDRATTSNIPAGVAADLSSMEANLPSI